MRRARLVLVLALGLALASGVAWLALRSHPSASATAATSTHGERQAPSAQTLDIAVPVDASPLAPPTDRSSPRAAVDSQPSVAPADERYVLARLVGPDGTPLAGLQVELTTNARRGSDEIADEGVPARTDAHGRLRARIVPRWVPGVTRTWCVRCPASDGADPRAAAVDLSFALPNGDAELGDCVVGAPSVLASGVVFDAKGEPAYRARVVGEVRGGRVAESFDVSTDRDGRFAVESRVQELPRSASRSLTLRAGAHRHAWSDPIECPLGTADLSIRLVGGGAIRGTLAADEPWAGSTLSVVARRSDRELGVASEVRAEIETELEPPPFFFPRLAPGTYRVEARSPLGETLATVDGVVVRDGERTDDPRLAPFVVPAVPSALLAFVDSDGSASRGIELSRWIAGGSDRERWLAFGSVPGTVHVRAGPSDGPLLVRARHAPTGRVDVVPGDHVVVLATAARVQLAFSRTATSAERARNVTLEWVRRPWPDLDFESTHEFEFGVDWVTGTFRTGVATEAAKALVADVPELANERPLDAATYELVWHADPAGGADGERHRWVDPRRSTLSIAPTSALQRATIDVPDDLLGRLDRAETSSPRAPVDPWRAAPTFPPKPLLPGKR